MTDRCRVYIAGAVTGVDGYMDNFSKAEVLLKSIGLEPVNPVAPGLVAGVNYRYYINRGFDKLMGCDMICLLPDWSESKGARLEKHYAEAVGMPAIFIKDLDKFQFESEVFAL